MRRVSLVGSTDHYILNCHRVTNQGQREIFIRKQSTIEFFTSGVVREDYLEIMQQSGMKAQFLSSAKLLK